MYSTRQTVTFIAILCFAVALILSTLASLLKDPQERARELYRSKQLLISAAIISPEGNLQMPDGSNAKWQKGLVPSDLPTRASDRVILEIYEKRVRPILTNSQGDVITFQEAGTTVQNYIEEHWKRGFARLPQKLLYEILGDNGQVNGYVIPINGFGLWGPIYGYLGLEGDADTVTWTTWYDQIETPGLGGNIELASWQEQFDGKQIFKPGMGSLEKAPLGITVVRTTVNEEFGESPEGKSAVDGITGATVTSVGVTQAYKQSLKPYRNFLIKANERWRAKS
ncbi:MAG: NADH:ubiquinone reductase (Na(+)-transporting) subunit C [Simkaniaceae bacterium]|nr:NADH:ubiquinone reductase (Na(+)-transporting) subunit C [Simkaniaceae bacterium]